MWAPVEFSTFLGDELRGLGEAFIGRRVMPRYCGDMQCQASRLLGFGEGGYGRCRSGARPELVAEFGYDTKFAMHCARLGFQCIELLTAGGLCLPVEGELAEWLRAVRYREVPFEDWRERAFELDHQVGLLADHQAYRPEPDRQRMEVWAMSAHQRMWEDTAP